MTSSEKELIDEKFKGLYTLLHARFENLEEKLERIETQTIKTNGRVTELESKERNHLTVCPNISAIASIEKRMGFWAWFNTPIRIALFFGLVLFVSAIFNSTELWNFVEKIFKLF